MVGQSRFGKFLVLAISSVVFTIPVVVGDKIVKNRGRLNLLVGLDIRYQ